MNIYVVRHGQNEDNAEGLLNGLRDRPLTAIGVAQANEAAENIAATGIVFDEVYTSPLVRAKKTAEIIVARLGLPAPKVLDDLIERDFGVMTGVPQSEIAARCSPDIIETPTVTYFLSPEDGETFPQLIARSQRLLAQLSAEHDIKNVLLVTHSDTGKMLYAAYYGLPWKDVLKQFHFGNSEMLKLSQDSPASETHVFQITQHNS